MKEKVIFNDIIVIWYLKISFGYGFILFSNKSILFPKNKYFRIFSQNYYLTSKII